MASDSLKKTSQAHGLARVHGVEPVVVDVSRKEGHQKAVIDDPSILQYMYLGDGMGFQSEVEALPGWSALGWGWPLNGTQCEVVTDRIKGSQCTWLHWNLDLRCGKEVVTMALRLARLQRRAQAYFLVVCPAVWEERTENLSKHEITFVPSASHYVWYQIVWPCCLLESSACAKDS